MDQQAAWYREVDNAFSTSRDTMLSLQNELARIGRVYRDIWFNELQAKAAAAQQGNLSPDWNDYRNSGHAVMEWINLGVAIWRIHNLLDPDPPELDIVDPSKVAADVANITTLWLEGGDHGGDPLTTDVYNICLTLSRLGHSVYQACQRYDYKIKVYIDALPVPSSCDGVTGRTRKQWQDCRIAYEDYWRAFFNQLTTQGYGYTPHVFGF